MSRVRADDLLYLLALARTGRMADAAQRLGVEHTTVSRRVAALEKALGRRLVDRTTRGCLLTDDGERLIAHAEKIESALHGVDQLAVSPRSVSLGGTIRIASTDGIGSTVIAEALVELRRAHPRLEIELTTALRRFDVTSKDYDVAITVQRLPSQRLAVMPLTDYSLGLYATRRYLETHPPVRQREDLENHSLAWYIDSLLDIPELDVFDASVISRRRAMRSSSIFGQVSFVKAGGGIGLLPKYLAIEHPELERVLADDVSVRLTFWLVARKQSLALARVQAAVDCLTIYVASIQDRFLF
ncbi:LysR family transcriptional regulator [Pseudonocardia asaccharolytica]|uniref:LysR family transcriptional regulator n=1 Tax=Pseudonocardia asaccharolytica DSM 44247 = NBRC 16224 TaxID=1123024 RepID=A0A511D6J6_9PSEU|nr:LysR family transcriptional regulator [Pseudonocardia asaccharolytica]GEL20083.1 LysR family transcriptional regulator [Pseudonocardia asaccharolytica DSM 44247 = NBRC 16224]